MMKNFKKTAKKSEVHLAEAKHYLHGIRLAYFVLISLLKEGRFGQVAVYILHASARFAGDSCGRFRT